MKCIGMWHAPAEQETAGGENFGAAEAKCVERNRLRGVQFV